MARKEGLILAMLLLIGLLTLVSCSSTSSDQTINQQKIQEEQMEVKECMLTGPHKLVVGIGKLCSTVKDCQPYTKYYDDLMCTDDPDDCFPDLICAKSEFMSVPAGCKVDENCYPRNSDSDQVLKRHDGYKETIRCRNNVCEWTKGILKLTGRLNINAP